MHLWLSAEGLTKEIIRANSGWGHGELKQKMDCDGRYPKEFWVTCGYWGNHVNCSIEDRVERHKRKARRQSEVYWLIQEELQPDLKQKHLGHSKGGILEHWIDTIQPKGNPDREGGKGVTRGFLFWIWKQDNVSYWEWKAEEAMCCGCV